MVLPILILRYHIHEFEDWNNDMSLIGLRVYRSLTIYKCLIRQKNKMIRKTNLVKVKTLLKKDRSCSSRGKIKRNTNKMQFKRKKKKLLTYYNPVGGGPGGGPLISLSVFWSWQRLHQLRPQSQRKL